MRAQRWPESNACKGAVARKKKDMRAQQWPESNACEGAVVTREKFMHGPREMHAFLSAYHCTLACISRGSLLCPRMHSSRPTVPLHVSYFSRATAPLHVFLSGYYRALAGISLEPLLCPRMHFSRATTAPSLARAQWPKRKRIRGYSGSPREMRARAQ